MARKNSQGAGSRAFQCSDGRWVCQARFGFKSNGKPDRRSYYGASADEARAKMQAALVDRDRGMVQPVLGLTLQRHLDNWLRNSIRPVAAAATLDTYWQHVTKYIAPSRIDDDGKPLDGRPLPLPALGGVRLAKLLPAHIRAWQNDLLTHLAPRTAAMALTVLRIALNEAVADGLISRNVASLIKRPKIEDRKVQPLEPPAVPVFLKAIAGERFEALYALTLRLGLRKSEILGVAWHNIDLEAGTMTISQTLKRTGRIDGQTALAMSDPKTDASRRILALPATAIATLRAHRARQAQDHLLAGAEWNNQNNLVFTNSIGRPLDPTTVHRDFKRILRKAGLRDFRFHDLRHSTASLLLNEGTPLKVIQELLGHSSINITANIYGHLTETTMRAVADTMDGILAR